MDALSITSCDDCYLCMILETLLCPGANKDKQRNILSEAWREF